MRPAYVTLSTTLTTFEHGWLSQVTQLAAQRISQLIEGARKHRVQRYPSLSLCIRLYLPYLSIAMTGGWYIREIRDRSYGNVHYRFVSAVRPYPGAKKQDFR